MTQNSNRILQPYGLTHSQWQVLYHVAKANGGTITQKDLLIQIHLESATLTKLIDALVQKKWLIRKEGSSDRRVNTLTFTKTGKENWRKLPDPIAQGRAIMLRNITLEEVEQTRKILERAFKNLKAAEKP